MSEQNPNEASPLLEEQNPFDNSDDLFEEERRKTVKKRWVIGGIVLGAFAIIILTIVILSTCLKPSKKPGKYRVTTLKWESAKLASSRNSKIFLKQHETWAKLSSNEVVAMTKFHDVWRKIMNIALVANFAGCSILKFSSFKDD